MNYSSVTCRQAWLTKGQYMTSIQIRQFPNFPTPVPLARWWTIHNSTTVLYNFDRFMRHHDTPDEIFILSPGFWGYDKVQILSGIGFRLDILVFWISLRWNIQQQHTAEAKFIYIHNAQNWSNVCHIFWHFVSESSWHQNIIRLGTPIAPVRPLKLLNCLFQMMQVLCTTVGQQLSRLDDARQDFHKVKK